MLVLCPVHLFCTTISKGKLFIHRIVLAPSGIETWVLASSRHVYFLNSLTHTTPLHPPFKISVPNDIVSIIHRVLF